MSAAFHNCANLYPENRFFSRSHPIHDLVKQQRKPDPYAELVACLVRIVTRCPPFCLPQSGTWDFFGLYKGPTSAAYLFLQLSEIYSNLTVQDKSLKEWCLAYLEPHNVAFQNADHQSPDATNCGIANETLAHACTLAVATKDSPQALKVCSYSSKITAHMPEECDEWMFGRAGYLYYLRRLRLAFQDNQYLQQTLATTINLVIEAIITAPRPWKWRGKEFIGAAHGTLGTLVQIVRADPATAYQFDNLLLETLEYQLPTGNFPISPINPKEDIYVQFCHGSPGAAVSLLALRPYYPNIRDQIDEALKRTTEDIWKRGLLVKEPCLCHGIAGNALALVDDKGKFEYFVSCVTSQVLHDVWGDRLGAQKGDEVCGVQWGEAGRAWLWSVADRGMKNGCITFDDI